MPPPTIIRLLRVLLWVLVAGCFLSAVARLLDNRPFMLDVHANGMTMQTSVSPGRILMPGEEVSVHWDVINTQAIYVNEQGRSGKDDIIFKADACNAIELRAIHIDSSESTYSLRPTLSILDGITILLIVVGCLITLIIGFIQPIPIISPISYTLVRFFSRKPLDLAYRIILLRIGLLISISVFIFYASVPFCSGQNLFSFLPVYSLYAGVFALCIITLLVLFLMSLYSPESLLHIGYLITHRTPRPVMLAGVFSIWWLMLSMLAMWGYRLPASIVVPLVVWVITVGYVAVLLNGQSRERISSIAWLRKYTIYHQRYARISIGLLLWLTAWYLPWQELILDTWLRVGLSVGLFILPGAFLYQLISNNTILSISRLVSTGFVFSVTITIALGLGALLLGLSLSFVMVGLMLIGGASLTGLIWQQKLQLPVPDDSSPPIYTAAMLAGIVAIIIFSRLSFSYMSYQPFSVDYWTQTAYTTYFADADSYELEEILLGTDNSIPPRFWLYYLPLPYAAIGQLAHTHVTVHIQIIGTFIAIISFVSIYALAQALHFNRAMSWLAILAQITCLALLLDNFEAGHSFVQRTAIDKIVAAFILTPILFRLILEYLEQATGRRFILFVLVAFAFPFTHGTITALVALIVGIFLIWDGAITRRYKPHFLILITIIACVSLPFLNLILGFQNIWQRNTGSLFEGVADYHLELLNIVNENYYAITSNIADGPAFVLLLAAVLVIVTQVGRSRGGRLMMVTFIPLLLALSPHTAPLLGRAITPFHLWRVPWLIPFGVIIVFAYHHIQIRFPQRISSTALLIIIIAMLSIILGSLQTQSWVAIDLEASISGDSNRILRTRRHLVGLAEFFDRYVDEKVLILGDVHIGGWIPSLTSDTRSLVFRRVEVMVNQSGISPAGAQARYNAYLDFFQSADDNIRLEILDTFEIDFLIVRKGNTTIESFSQLHSHRVQLVETIYGYQVYEIKDPAS